MRLISALVVAAPALLSLGLGSPLAAQQVVALTDAPFSATLSVIDNEGRTYPMQKFARAGNGSTYVASYAKDGHPTRVTIEDVPNSRIIEFTPQPPSYTYTLRPALKNECRTYSVDRYREIFQRAQQDFIDRPDRDKPGGSHHHEVPLGVRQEDGLTLVGHRNEATLQNGKKHAVEMWMSDLGLAIDIKGNGPAPEGIRAWTVTDFKRVEPDPTLFEIPAEYLPGHDPLLNAKTVFVENETGDPEVKDTAERDFNSWKTRTHLRPLEREEAIQGWRRITVVAAKEKADIIAVFTSVRNDDDASILPAMEMKIYAPNSDEPLFTHHGASNPNFKIQDELSPYTRDMVGGCVIALLNRLVNTRIGLINPPHQAAQPQPDQARLTE
jgi:hypothetical protein